MYTAHPNSNTAAIMYRQVPNPWEINQVAEHDAIMCVVQMTVYDGGHPRYTKVIGKNGYC